MVAYIPGIYILLLTILHFGEATKVNSGEFKSQKDSLTPLRRISYKNFGQNHLQRKTSAALLKRIRPRRKCQEGYVKTSLDGNNLIHCLKNVNNRNIILKKTFKQHHFQAGAPVKKKTPATIPSGSKRIVKNMVQKSPCPDGKPRCERQESKISYRCHTGLWCSKGQNDEAATNQKTKRLIDDTSSSSRQEQAGSQVTRDTASYKKNVKSWRKKKEGTSFGAVLRKAKECPFGLWCLEDDNNNEKEKGETDMEIKQESGHGHKEIVCAQGVDCAETMVSDDNAPTKFNHNTGKTNCPIGLWCSAKRQLGYEDSLTLEKCPPGLWCKRNNIMITKAADTKRTNKYSVKDGCPSGFYCSTKKEAGYEKLSQCPPGLWCKREDNMRGNYPKEAQFCPKGLKCSSKREAGYGNYVTVRHCPPGLWCKKDMTQVSKDDTTAKLNGMAAVSCPSGYDCSSKRLVNYENSESLRQCPPGLWCKRSVPIGDRILNKHCSTSPWCDLKLAVDNSARRMLNECPPGLWCKR